MRGSPSGNGTLTDPLIVLYRGSFDPANPCSNVAGVDDDSGGVGFDAALTLTTSGGSYVVVATSFANGQLGTYVLDVVSNNATVLNTTGALTTGDPQFRRPDPGSHSIATN